MGRQILGAVTQALAEHQRAHQAGDAGVDVHNGAAGEVEHAGATQEAAAPDPVGDRRVDHDRPDADEPQQGRELHAVGKRTGDKRRGDDGEGHLEDDEHGFGYGAVEGVHFHVAKHDFGKIPDKGVAFAEGEGIADDHPDDGGEAADGEALHHRRQDVLLAHHAGV